MTTVKSSPSVVVSASIPQNRLTIFGYTSPLSRVEISNPNIFSTTYSNSEGYFIFDRIIVPKNSGEYCLASKDDSLRLTPPLCLPPPPPANTSTNIGPIILAPTLSLDRSGEQLLSSGQSVPDSTVTLYFFQTESKAKLVKSASAFNLPRLTTTTDSNGNFSLNLPNQYASDFRYYATVITPLGYPSAKSNSLFFTFGAHFNYLYLLLLLLLPLLLLFRRKKHYLPAIINRWLPRPLYH